MCERMRDDHMACNREHEMPLKGWRLKAGAKVRPIARLAHAERAVSGDQCHEEHYLQAGGVLR